MSLYKDKKLQTIQVDVVKRKGIIEFQFHSDCGKFGTDEMLDSYTLTVERLLDILQTREDITDEENY